jgi:biopolymer transport protein ExbD
VKKIAVLLVLLAICFIATADTTNAEEPYSVAATMSAVGDGRYVVVEVTITEKATGKVVFHPRAQQSLNQTSSALSDAVEGQPQYEVRIVTFNGKAEVSFRAFEHIVQSSRVTAQLP